MEEIVYVKAFNDGYKLGRYRRDLSESLQQSLNPSSPYQSAMVEGMQIGEQEREQSRLAELTSLRDAQEPEQERDR